MNAAYDKFLDTMYLVLFICWALMICLGLMWLSVVRLLLRLIRPLCKFLHVVLSVALVAGSIYLVAYAITCLRLYAEISK